MSMWPRSIEEAKPQVIEAIELFGTFSPDAIDWLLPFVTTSGGVGDWQTYAAMVRGGEPVSNAAKAALGHPAWFKFGHPCWDRMTDVGRRDPKLAVDQLLEHVFWRQRLIHRRDQFVDLLRSGPVPGRPLYPEVTINADSLCCPAAQKISGTSFPYQRYPDLPLPDCNQLWCRCDWGSVRKRR